MKKFRRVLFTALTLGLFTITSCAKGWKPLDESVTTIRVAATPSPHAEILQAAKPLLEAKGYNLEIIEYNDYILPNTATEDGDVDANYFQHTPYLNSFNEEHNTHLISVGEIHYEPFAIYKGRKTSLSEVANGDTILVPNDTTNEARALLLLQEAGLITLKEDAGITATKKDIVENKYNLDIKELEAAQIPLNRTDAAYAVINGNYAIGAGLSSNDALQYESSTGLAAKTYGNVLVVRDGNQNHPAIQALYAVLKSEDIKKYITNTYNGGVLAI
ncbi:MAG: MetQ/NlpA family ABC transporter substrate-binding protein [Anaeroplasma sp.]